MNDPKPTAAAPVASAVSVSKLGYVEFHTPDLDRMIEYYTKILDFVLVDRTPTEAYVTPSFDHHQVMIRQGEAAARTVVGYQIAEPIADAERRLTAAGYRVQRRSDFAPYVPDLLVLAEPSTDTLIHLYDEQATSGIDGYTPLRPTKLGHVAAFVPGLGPLQDFYQGSSGSAGRTPLVTSSSFCAATPIITPPTSWHRTSAAGCITSPTRCVT